MRRRIALLLAVAAILAAQMIARAGTVYSEPNFFVWEKATLEVLIVPPAHGQVWNEDGVLGGGDINELNPAGTSYLRAVERSIAAWKNAVQIFGPAWLRNGLELNVSVVGRDPIPDAALFGPDIIVTGDEWKGPVLGVAYASRPCIVDISKFYVASFTYADMFNINGQEFAHCLGLQHVDWNEPVLDVMNGSYPHVVGAHSTGLHCPSSLNVLALEESFAKALGQGAGGRMVSVAADSYVQPASCS